MAGVSDLPFRTLVSSFGDDENKVSLTVSEMVPSTSQVMLLERRKSTDKIKRMYEEYQNRKSTEEIGKEIAAAIQKELSKTFTIK